MRKALLAVFSFFTFLFTFTLPINAQGCSTEGQTCRDTRECQIGEGEDCAIYYCRADTLESDVGTCTSSIGDPVPGPIYCGEIVSVLWGEDDPRPFCVHESGNRITSFNRCPESIQCCVDIGSCGLDREPEPTEEEVEEYFEHREGLRQLGELMGCPELSIDTAIGCIPFEYPSIFVAFFLRWGIGIGSGIAFLLIVYSGFMIMTSSGDPKRLQASKELLTAAIAGLMLLIFSVFVLQIIGAGILNIPGFGGSS